MTNPKTLLIPIGLILLLSGCAGQKKKTPTTPASSPATNVPQTGGIESISEPSETKRRILSLAKREWDYFGRQVVVIQDDEESIPHVGKWEDDAETYSVRVNWYWRAVGKPQLDGNHCSQPWSAAFVSWIMREAGVPEYQFESAEAHWMYLTRIAADAGNAYAAFAPRTITEYSPQPGDLICATRGHTAAPLGDGELQSYLLEHTKLHCDIVVERNGDTLAAIGGNVRNSVSKTLLKLDPEGRIQPTPRRPWFMIVENRL